jgi:hypothetical protein
MGAPPTTENRSRDITEKTVEEMRINKTPRNICHLYKDSAFMLKRFNGSRSWHLVYREDSQKEKEKSIGSSVCTNSFCELSSFYIHSHTHNISAAAPHIISQCAMSYLSLPAPYFCAYLCDSRNRTRTFLAQ